MDQRAARITGVIGVDCATQPRKVGLALGSYEDGAACIEQVLVGSMVTSVVERVADWTKRTPSTLIALDAPLGWPADLGRALHEHEAGVPVAVEANRLFRRTTDRFVKKVTGKQPLDVGADRIARTAHAALGFLQELRRRTGEAIPLAWNSIIGTVTYAIEVYPGATLAAYGVRASGYKGKEQGTAYKTVLRFLEERVALPHGRTLIESNNDALDAALCVLAAVDFLRGEALKPTDLDAARKEGWIWVRKPTSLGNGRE
jgi:hypothetical protein